MCVWSWIRLHHFQWTHNHTNQLCWPSQTVRGCSRLRPNNGCHARSAATITMATAIDARTNGSARGERATTCAAGKTSINSDDVARDIDCVDHGENHIETSAPAARKSSSARPRKATSPTMRAATTPTTSAPSVKNASHGASGRTMMRVGQSLNGSRCGTKESESTAHSATSAPKRSRRPRESDRIVMGVHDWCAGPHSPPQRPQHPQPPLPHRAPHQLRPVRIHERPLD